MRRTGPWRALQEWRAWWGVLTVGAAVGCVVTLAVGRVAAQDPAAEKQQTQKELAAGMQQLTELRKKQTELKRRLGKRDLADIHLTGADGKPVRLSALFGEKQDMLLIHNMGTSCAYCTLWADGLKGLQRHLEGRAALVVETPDAPMEQAKFAAARGWRFRMVSSKGTTLLKDTGFQLGGGVMPGVSALHKDADGKIRQVAIDFFGPGDDYCAAWPLMELLEGGVNGWVPTLK